MNQNSDFLENFNRKVRKTFKIPEILVFFDKINPYNENQVSEASGEILEKKYVVWYRAAVPWLVDIHFNGGLANFILAVFSLQPLHYFFILANGLTIWLAPKVISYVIAPFRDAAINIVREMPRK